MHLRPWKIICTQTIKIYLYNVNIPKNEWAENFLTLKPQTNTKTADFQKRFLKAFMRNTRTQQPRHHWKVTNCQKLIYFLKYIKAPKKSLDDIIKIKNPYCVESFYYFLITLATKYYCTKDRIDRSSKIRANSVRKLEFCWLMDVIHSAWRKMLSVQQVLTHLTVCPRSRDPFYCMSQEV